MKKVISHIALGILSAHCFADELMPDFSQLDQQGWPAAWLDEYKNLFTRIKVHNHCQIMLNSSSVESLFNNVKEIETVRNDVFSKTNAIVLGEKRRISVTTSSPYKNSRVLLYGDAPKKWAHFRVCSRPSAIGVTPEMYNPDAPPDLQLLVISNANFVSYFLPVDFVEYYYNNISVTMNYVPKQEDYGKGWLPDCLLSNDDWLFVANRINSLFDGDVTSLSQRKDIKLLQSKDMTLSLTERKTLPEGESVTLRWSVPSELKDCWIRFDTSEGRASIEDEKAQTVTVSHIPPKTPVTATLYAISPDGKEWRYTALEILAK